MNIKELLEQLESILTDAKEHLYEFADTQGDLRKKIRNNSKQFLEHIYKLQYYSNYSKTMHHWAAEVSASMYEICHRALKSTGKQVSTKFIVDEIKKEYINGGELSSIILDCYNKYDGVEIDDLNYQSVYDKIMSVVPSVINYLRTTKKPDMDYIIELVTEVNWK